MKQSRGVKSTLAAVRQYWDKKAVIGTTDCERVESGQRAQKMRFELFLLQNDPRGKSILDVGCGTGDFFAHLRKRKIDCRYTGFDISQEMIRRCRQRFKSGAFKLCDILELPKRHAFDYTVAFAIHNIKCQGAKKVLARTMRHQFELCRIGAHISILTDRYKQFASHIQAWRAEEVLTMALRITPYVVLRHDYLPNDFSVTLYREPLIDTCKTLTLE